MTNRKQSRAFRTQVKEKAKDIAKKAKDKIDDFKAYVKPDEDEVFSDDDFDDFVIADGDDDFVDFEIAESDEDFDNFVIDDDDFESDAINLDDYKTEVSEETAEVAEFQPVEIAEETEDDTDDVAVVTVDDEESPDEFEF